MDTVLPERIGSIPETIPKMNAGLTQPNAPMYVACEKDCFGIYPIRKLVKGVFCGFEIRFLKKTENIFLFVLQNEIYYGIM